MTLKPVHILINLRAAQSFILKHILPFTESTDTGDPTPVIIRLLPVSVSLHCLTLTSDCVNGEVVMGVRTSVSGWGGCYIG